MSERPDNLAIRDGLEICCDCRIWFANGDATGMSADAYQRIVADNAAAKLQKDAGVISPDYWQIIPENGEPGEGTHYQTCDTCKASIAYGNAWPASMLFHRVR